MRTLKKVILGTIIGGGAFLAIGMVVAISMIIQEDEIRSQVDTLKGSQEGSNQRLQEIVKSCTKKYPYVTAEDIKNYVSSDCLIEKAETVQDCQSYAEVKLIQFKNPYNSEDKRKFGSYFDSVDECVRKLAIQNHNIDACSSLDDSTVCVISYAEEFKEPKQCQKATDSQNCFQTLSSKLGFYVCNLTQNERSREDCGKNYITSNWYVKSQETCSVYHDGNIASEIACTLEKLQLEGISKQDLLSWKSGVELTACSSYGFPNWMLEKGIVGDYCMAALGIYFRDLVICDKAGVARAECYGYIAATEDFVSLDTCDRLGTEESMGCYSFVAYRLNDISICDSFPNDPYFKKNCINQVNQRNQ